MSDESPWGAPPPSNPYGPPQPPPQQPPTPPTAQHLTPYPQSGGGGYGGPPSPYGSYGGPGGQPPRKKTGLIIGIVLAVVVVVAALVVTVVVTSGGDDDPDEAGTSDTGSPTQTTDDPSSDPTASDPTASDPTSDPTSSAPTDPEPTGPQEGTFAGEGYELDIPTGWADVTAEADDIPNAQYVDAILVLGSSLELSQSNVIIEALSAGAADEPDDLKNLWKRNLASSDNPTVTDSDGTTIDGERAIGVTIDGRTNAGGIAITQLCYLVLHDGRQYSIGLTLPKENDDVSRSDFEAMLSSWTWTS